jgi:hypothetical protein
VRQLVADVWQDEHTTGARPPMEHYTAFSGSDQLYLGPVDGWFAIYHRSILPLLLGIPKTQYFPLGCAVARQLARRGQHAVLDCGMKVFHVIGPEYASAFDMLAFEIEKYRALNRLDIESWYRSFSAGGHAEDVARRLAAIRGTLDSASVS